MSLTIFKFENQPISVIKEGNDIWFKGKSVAAALGYVDTNQSIRKHVFDEDKLTRENEGSGQNRRYTDINEAGVYLLIFGSKLESSKKFKNWVFTEVLPSIRKTGQYNLPNLVGKQKMLLNETDLHYDVVKNIRTYHKTLILPGLGEIQDTSEKRIDAWQKGYQKRTPDIVCPLLHKNYTGFTIEFKNPNEKGVLYQE